MRTVPSETLRQGIVRYNNTEGVLSTLSPGDIKAIDPAGIGVSETALKVFQSYPMPNMDEVGEGLNTRGYRFKAPVHGRYNIYIAKIDAYHDKAAKHSVFLHGNLQNDNVQSTPWLPGQTNGVAGRTKRND